MDGSFWHKIWIFKIRFMVWFQAAVIDQIGEAAGLTDARPRRYRDQFGSR